MHRSNCASRDGAAPFRWPEPCVPSFGMAGDFRSAAVTKQPIHEDGTGAITRATKQPGRTAMSFERHHPNRVVERNLANARDLRSAWLLAGVATLGERIARAWRDRRRGTATRLKSTPHPIGKGMQRAATIAGVALLLAAGAAAAQDVVRVRGTIERVEDEVYVVKTRDGGTMRLNLAANAGVAASVKSAMADIKPGAFIGVAALPQAD